MKHYGEMLREARERARLSRNSVAKKAGISEGHLRFIEKGERETKLPTLRRLAIVLGIDETPLIKAWFDEHLEGFDSSEIKARLPKGVDFQELKEIYMVDQARKTLSDMEDLSFANAKKLAPRDVMRLKMALQNCLGFIRELENAAG